MEGLFEFKAEPSIVEPGDGGRIAAEARLDDDGVVGVALDFPTLLLLTATLWAVYTVWAKHLVPDVHPVPMFTVLSVYTPIGFAVLAYVTGNTRVMVTAG
jgi:hypothetical protein